MASLKNQPAFETESTSGAETMTAQAETPTVQEAAAADVAASTAIAKAATGTAVGAVNAKFKMGFADKKDVFDTPAVEGLSLAVPRIKGEQGSFFKDATDYGGKIRFELISWNHRWVVGTGEDDKEAKDYFRVSYDGHSISGSGESLQAYLEDLKAQGFDKARISQYGDIFGFVTWTEKGGDIPFEEREIACLQASPTSLGAFVAFCTTRGLLESRGLVQPLEVIEVHAEKRQSGNNKFTNFSFHAPKA